MIGGRYVALDSYTMICGHYVVVTGVIGRGSETWLEVSSNGSKRYIDFKEYLSYTKEQEKRRNHLDIALGIKDYRWDNNILKISVIPNIIVEVSKWLKSSAKEKLQV